MATEKKYPRGTVFSGNHGEAAAFAREKVASGEWTSEEALAFTERVYRQTMLDQLMGVPQAEVPEELPEHRALFTNPPKGKIKKQSKS
jgi:hypothetical protein